MTRHSKNATAGPTYTYYEKTKDCRQSGYGTKEVRLGKDAIKDFDCCALSLQPCINPVITPEGWIYEKEAILEYILHKKIENAKMMKQFEKQKDNQEREKNELSEIATKEKLEKFLRAEGKLVVSDSNASGSAAAAAGKSSSATATAATTSKSADDSKAAASSSKSVSNMSGDLSKKLPSFWIPSLCPDSKTHAPMKKPDTTIYCPMSGTPLAMKDLVDVKFKLFEDKSDPTKAARALVAKTERYVCPVTNDMLNNAMQCVVLKTSGSVVTAEAVEKIIKKDMIDPINGRKMQEKDLIYIQRGGTGFAGSGVKLNSKKFAAAMI